MSFSNHGACVGLDTVTTGSFWSRMPQISPLDPGVTIAFSLEVSPVFIQQTPCPCASDGVWRRLLLIWMYGVRLKHSRITSILGLVQWKWVHCGLSMHIGPQSAAVASWFSKSPPGKLQFWDHDKPFSCTHEMVKYPQTAPARSKRIAWLGEMGPDLNQQVPFCLKIYLA